MIMITILTALITALTVAAGALIAEEIMLAHRIDEETDK